MIATDVTRWFRASLCAGLMAGLLPAAAAAQDPNTGALTFTAAFDVPSLYMFRGIRQEVDPDFTMQPYADLKIDLSSGDGAVKSSAINFGVWNSLHTGSSGSGCDGGGCSTHYEEDFYAAFTLGFGGATSLTTQYTAYTSPNSSFATAKEISFKIAQGSRYAPYALVAFEFDTEPGRGQADGGDEAGTYLELGAGPSFPLGSRATLTVPVRMGLSLGDYYELNGDDHFYGFFGIGGLITVPLSSVDSRFGEWNFHFGGDYFHLGETTHSFNVDVDGETSPSKFVGMIGIGVSY